MLIGRASRRGKESWTSTNGQTGSGIHIRDANERFGLEVVRQSTENEPI